MKDEQIRNLINAEFNRQNDFLEMIPSENFVSADVLEACGSILSNKYAEGYPEKRYYQGNDIIDDVEKLAIERAKKLFNAEHVNVQPHSGSQANMAVYRAVLKKGDKVLGLNLSDGGHLTHGSSVNFSGKDYDFVHYNVDKETRLLNFDEIKKIVLKEKPKLIVSGYSAYPRKVDFKKFHSIAKEVGAISMADISHIAGLIVGGVHESPLPFTDIVTSTTHKSLRGPRGAIIMCKEEFAKDIDKELFPGIQGGPHQNMIAGKAISFNEALSPEFKEYSRQVVKNSKALAESLMKNKIKLVSNGTDTHLILIDLVRTLGDKGLGKKVAVDLEEAGIVVNANMIPYDPSTPYNPSGIRLGTPFLTSRFMKEKEMDEIGELISKVILNNSEKEKIRMRVLQLCRTFPLENPNFSQEKKLESKHVNAPILLDGEKVSKNILNKNKKFIDEIEKKPKISIFLVGNDSASKNYVNIKLKKLKDVGILSDLEKFPENSNYEDIIKKIKEKNEDESTTGIILQLPLPNGFNTKKIINSISPEKDVDGLTDKNREKLSQGNEDLVSCAPKGIIHLLEEYGLDIKNKNVAIIGDGFLVGQPLSCLLKNRGIKFTIYNDKDFDADKIKQADVIISATGVPRLIKKDIVKEGAIVIDAGSYKDKGVFVGDFQEEVKDIASYITPVPGGIGPMTVSMLIENIVKIHKRKL